MYSITGFGSCQLSFNTPLDGKKTHLQVTGVLVVSYKKARAADNPLFLLQG